MHLVEPGEQHGPRLRCETVPKLLADLVAQVAEGDDGLEPVTPGHPLENLDDPPTGMVADRCERAIGVVVRSRAREHDSPADGSDERPDRLHACLVAGVADPRRGLPEHLALRDGQVVVDGVGEAQRQQAVRKRRPIDARLPYLMSSTHGAVFGATTCRVYRM